MKKEGALKDQLARNEEKEMPGANNRPKISKEGIWVWGMGKSPRTWI